MLYRIVLSMCWKGTRKLTCPRLFLFSNLILVSDLLISWLLHHLLWATLAWTAWMRLKLSWLWKRYVTYTLQRCLYNLYLQEFSIVIPDVEADEIQTVGQGVYSFHVTWNVRWQFFFSAIDYIAKTPEGLFPFLNLSCFWLMEIFLYSPMIESLNRAARRRNLHTVYRSHHFFFPYSKRIPSRDVNYPALVRK